MIFIKMKYNLSKEFSIESTDRSQKDSIKLSIMLGFQNS